MIFILLCLFSAVHSQVSIFFFRNRRYEKKKQVKELQAGARLRRLSSSKGGPFKVVVKQFGPCKEQTPHFKMWDTKIRIVKRNSPLFIDTNFWNEITFDDKIEATITASKWGDGGWKENFFTQNMGGICTSLRRFVPDLFDNLLKSMGQNECPIRAGNHSVRNLEAKITFNAPAGPYGKFKSDISLGTKKLKAGCFNMVYELVPKKGHSNY